MNSLDPTEIQYGSDGSIEESFKPDSFHGKVLISGLKQFGFSGDTSQVELISHHEPDQYSYTEEAIVLSIACDHRGSLADYYAMKIFKSGQRLIKLYDLDFSKFSLPEFPAGATPQRQFGVGYYPNETRLIDVYFTHPSQKQVEGFYGLKICVQLPGNGMYGVTYNQETHVVSKIKRYYYPHDKLLRYPEKV